MRVERSKASQRSKYINGTSNVKSFGPSNFQKIDSSKCRCNMEESLILYKNHIETVLTAKNAMEFLCEGVPVPVRVENENGIPRSLYVTRKLLREVYLLDIRRVDKHCLILYSITKDDLKEMKLN